MSNEQEEQSMHSILKELIDRACVMWVVIIVMMVIALREVDGRRNLVKEGTLIVEESIIGFKEALADNYNDEFIIRNIKEFEEIKVKSFSKTDGYIVNNTIDQYHNQVCDHIESDISSFPLTDLLYCTTSDTEELLEVLPK